jgi:hypothetical protein
MNSMKSRTTPCGAKNQQAETSKATLELGFRHAAAEPQGDVAEQRTRTGRDRERGRRAADDRGAEEHQLRSVRTGLEAVAGGCRFVRRKGFTGQHRLLHRQVARLEQTAIGRHEIAGGETEDVAQYDGSQRHLHPGAVPQDSGGWLDRCAEALRCPLRSVRLPEVDRHAKHDHRRDDEGVDVLSERSLDRTGGKQDERQRVGEQVQQLNDCRQATDRRGLVWTVQMETSCSL